MPPRQGYEVLGSPGTAAHPDPASVRSCALALALSLFCAAVFAAALVSRLRSGPAPAAPPPGPGREAGQLLQQMDGTADPCTDFYQFSCGRLEQRNLAVVRAALETVPPSPSLPLLEKVRRYYLVCRDRDEVGENSTRQLVARLVAGLDTSLSDKRPERSLARILTSLNTKLGTQPLLRLSVGIDDRNSSRHILKVDQSKLSLGQADDYPAGGRHLVTHMAEVQQLLTGTAPSPDQLTAMRAIVRLEAELAKALIPSSEQRAGGQEVVTAKEASGRFPWLDWVELVRLAVRAGPAEPLLLPGRLPVYLARLDAVLGHRLHSAAGRAELSHFLNWRAVASLLPHLPRPFRQSRADLAARLAGIQPRALGKLRAVRALVGFPDTVTNLTKLERLYGGLAECPSYAECAVEQIARQQQPGRLLARLRRPVARQAWQTPPQTTNAFYTALMNEIILPLGILQSPFYDSSRHEVLNYGGIGFSVGHELTHAFDDHGRRYGASGSLNDWWSEETLQQFLARTKCLVQQYGNLSLAGTLVSGLNTLGENIADNGGLKAAYNAYFYVEQQTKSDFPVTGLNFTREQLFFIGYSQVWCNGNSEEYELSKMVSNPHPPSKLRVTATLANSPQFSQAFHCPPGSNLNPTVKCSVW